MSLPSWIEGGKEILEFSDVEGMENFERQGRIFFEGKNQIFPESGKGRTHTSNAKMNSKIE